MVILLAIPAAYALSVKPVEKWTDVMFFFLSTKFLPAVAGLLPLYLIAKTLGLLDNINFIIILYTAMNLPIAVWMLRSFLADIPVELFEAAAIDGAGLIRTLRSIIVPIISPGIAATALICFIFSWNELLLANTLTSVVAPDRAGLPDQLRHLAGPVPGQGLRRGHRGLAARADRRLRRPGQAGAGPLAGRGQVSPRQPVQLDAATVGSLDVPGPDVRPQPGHHRHRPLRRRRLPPRAPGDVPRPR